MNNGLRWLPVTRINRSLIPPFLRSHLLDSGSLTSRLANYCQGNFNLHLIRQAWQNPLPEEVHALGLRRRNYALVREIYLQCNDVPWIYGRSIIPAQTCTSRERRLAFWGQRSLGNYLFSGHNVRRSAFEIAVISPRDKLFHLAGKAIVAGSSHLWGRRSIFYIKNKPLLVVEVFLDNLIKCVRS